MFKLIKYIVSFVRKNDEYHSALMNMILLFRKPDNLFVESSIDEVNYVFKEIIKLQKENTELKEKLNNEGIRIKK